MQISFDPRDPNACASVLAVIAALHGERVDIPAAFPDIDHSGDPGAAIDDSLDPAEAFDAPDPAAAFGAPNVPSALPAAESSAVTTPTPPPAPSPTGEIDADGVPWDSRIHSGPADKKPKNADGRWRRGRGVSDEVHAAITAELRAAQGLAPIAADPTPAAAPPAPPVAAPPVPPAPVAAAPIPAPPAPPPIPAAAGTESGPAVATVAASPAPTNFAEVMRYVTGRQTAGTLTVAQTSEVCAALNLAGLRDLMQQPDMIPAFMASLPEAAA